MQEEFKKIEETVEHFKIYLNTKIAQAKLSAAEKTSDLLSVFIAKTLVAFVLFFFVLFGSQAAAYGIGDYFGKTWMGFVFVAGFYLLAGLLIWLGRETLLQTPIMNAILRRLFINENNEDEKD
jgi:hypothetical protein